MPAGTGRVGGEHAAGAHRLDGLGERRGPCDDQLADPFERQEPGVALVGVEHLGFETERAQHPDATDAEHDLLAQPVLGVAAVQAVGDVGALGAVAVDRGVEQVQRARGPTCTCQARTATVLAGHVDGDLHAGVGERQTAGVEAGEALLLVAVGVQPLAEVALGVQQPDRDQRHARGRWWPSGGRRPARRGRRCTAAASR